MQLTACSCSGLPTLDQSIAGADEIFVGQVSRIKRDRLVDLIFFEVERKWKGSSRKEVVLVELWGSSCSLGFEEGMDYLIYARKIRQPVWERIFQRQSYFELRLCTRSIPEEGFEDSYRFRTDQVRLMEVFPEPVLLAESGNRLFWYRIGAGLLLFLYFVLKRYA